MQKELYESTIRIQFNQINELADKLDYLHEETKRLEKENNNYRNILTNLNEYLDLVETLATVDHINILSISKMKKILRGEKE